MKKVIWLFLILAMITGVLPSITFAKISVKKAISLVPPNTYDLLQKEEIVTFFIKPHSRLLKTEGAEGFAPSFQVHIYYRKKGKWKRGKAVGTHVVEYDSITRKLRITGFVFGIDARGGLGRHVVKSGKLLSDVYFFIETHDGRFYRCRSKDPNRAIIPKGYVRRSIRQFGFPARKYGKILKKNTTEYDAYFRGLYLSEFDIFSNKFSSSGRDGKKITREEYNKLAREIIQQRKPGLLGRVGNASFVDVFAFFGAGTPELAGLGVGFGFSVFRALFDKWFGGRKLTIMDGSYYIDRWTYVAWVDAVQKRIWQIEQRVSYIKKKIADHEQRIVNLENRPNDFLTMPQKNEGVPIITHGEIIQLREELDGKFSLMQEQNKKFNEKIAHISSILDTKEETGPTITQKTQKQKEKHKEEKKAIYQEPPFTLFLLENGDVTIQFTEKPADSKVFNTLEHLAIQVPKESQIFAAQSRVFYERALFENCTEKIDDNIWRLPVLWSPRFSSFVFFCVGSQTQGG